MDKIFAIENGLLFVNHNGWHACTLVDGNVILGDKAKGVKPRELFNAYEIKAKCGSNFGIAVEKEEDKEGAE